MKTTSYEISKELAKIGFEAHHCGGYYVEGRFFFAGKIKDDFDYKAYDLETILEKIPFVLYNEENKAYWFKMDMQNLEYITFEQETNIDFYTPRQKDESLADTAARLFIKLHEKEIKY